MINISPPPTGGGAVEVIKLILNGFNSAPMLGSINII